ncbi:MFS general substrate transporter [Gymnopus androsaceus JB14]|uniref:MFS general substrate transporter n=1 Tax=Gymnopus androsaceus JB14 TaxID=1447944 RepID=A0A6A4HFT1_9AGAR|nr:MFS general substrate transporter [Gymnopus androsaceus JB14]
MSSEDSLVVALQSGTETVTDPPISETTPLLSSTTSEKKPWYSIERYAKSPAIYILPVILGSRLAIFIPTSTTVYIIQQVVCRSYYRANDPSRIPPGGTMPDDLCIAPDVQQLYSAIVSSIGVLNGIACMIGYSVLNHFSSRYGRKPAILLLLGIALTSNLSLLLSQMMSDEIWEVVWLGLWVLCDAFASVYLMIFLATTYVFDLVGAENRSSFLSMMYGCGILGGALAFGTGGAVTTGTHNILPVYRLAAILHVLVLVFTFFFLPESFTMEKRNELLRRSSEESQNNRNGLFQPIVSKLKTIVAPLKVLKPKFNYKPDQMGFFLAFLSLSYTFTTILVVPTIIPILRPIYKRRARQHHLTDSESSDQDTVSESTDYLDIHIAVVSLIVEAGGYVLFSAMTTKTGQYIAAFIIALGGGARAVFRSVVAASVEPLKQGETLAAVEMVASIGMVISPLYMGAVLSATIVIMPALIFYTIALIVLLGASVLFLIKDSDRYIKHPSQPLEVNE